MDIFIVMPAYNSEGHIKKVFSRIPPEVLKQIKKIIIVNDGSTDRTIQESDKLRKKYRNKIILINHEKNKGYGAAQKTGFNEALRRNADIVVLLHSDGQYPPEKLSEFIEPIMGGVADITAGSRRKYGNMAKQGMPLHKYLGNLLLTSLLNLRFHQNITSYHSGYKAYSKNALRRVDFNNLSNYYHFDSEMIIESAKKGLKIEEIPIPTSYGDEISYLNPIKYGWEIIKLLLKGGK
jgi:glycosyltransferase involved in cell wall biosynthesis